VINCNAASELARAEPLRRLLDVDRRRLLDFAGAVGAPGRGVGLVEEQRAGRASGGDQQAPAREAEPLRVASDA
jgi:hypothetical protein